MFLVGSHPLALSQPAGGDACEGVYKPRDGNLGWVAHEQMDMVVLAIHLDQFCAKVGAHAREHLLECPGARRSALCADTWLRRQMHIER